MIRSIIYGGVLAVIALLTVACNKTDIDTPQDDLDGELVVNTSDLRTSITVSKADTQEAAEEEAKIRNLMMLLYFSAVVFTQVNPESDNT